MFVIGFLLFCLGAVPYFGFAIMYGMGFQFALSRPNPVGLGCMLWIAGIPGIVLMIVGMGRWLGGKQW
jgi:hypothetical protein